MDESSRERDGTGFGERVLKLQRAHGGCLGAEGRRRTRQAAIRLGELQSSFDPGISEWGNPAEVNLGDSRLNT